MPISSNVSIGLTSTAQAAVTSKFTAAGLLGGSVSQLPLATFLVDGVASLRPSFKTISAAASYPIGDFEMVGNGSAGGTTFTRTAGDPSSDAGTGQWWCVVEYTDGTLDFNLVLSGSGDVFTMAHQFTKAVSKLHQAHDENLGQHFSPKGGEAAAEYVYNVTRQEAFFEKSQYSLWPDDEFAQDPWARLSTDKAPLPYNGAANNSIDYVDARNPWTPTGEVVCCDAVETLEIESNAQGEGFTVDIATNGSPCFLRTSVGFRSDGSTGLVEVLFDGVSQDLPNAGVFGDALYVIKLPVPSTVTTITVRAQRTNTGTDVRGLRLGGLYLTDLSDVPDPTVKLISPTSRVGLFGDSYFDDANVNGAPFHNKFASLHSGFLSNHAIGGSRISAWIDNLQGWLDSDNLDIAILHSGINEANNTPVAALTPPEYWVLVNQFIATCKANNVVPVVFTAIAVSSVSQMPDLFRQSAMQDVPYLNRWPQQIGDWHTEATTSEIANSNARINQYKKTTGKQITRLNDSVTLTATGSAPTDTWS